MVTKQKRNQSELNNRKKVSRKKRYGNRPKIWVEKRNCVIFKYKEKKILQLKCCGGRETKSLLSKKQNLVVKQNKKNCQTHENSFSSVNIQRTKELKKF